MPAAGNNMMTKIKIALSIACFIGACASAWGDEFSTKDEAVAMVKKAVAFVKKEGSEKAYAAFTAKGDFADRDLYVVVYSNDGKVLAHGSTPKLVGKDMSDAQDVDGKYYIKERLALAAKQESFWQDYKFTNPVSKKIEPKQMYCERLNDTAVCGGVYLR